MNFPFFIAKRYLLSKSKTNAINIITMIAGFGVLVSTIVLFLVLSHFSGLRTLSNSMLKASDPDLRISVTKGKSFIFTDNIKKIIKGIDGISVFSKVIEERAFLKYGDKKTVAQIKGVETHYNKIIDIDSSMTVGNWLDKGFPDFAILGDELIGKLTFDKSSDFEVIVPKGGKGFINPKNAYNSHRMFLNGGFRGLEELNQTMFVNISVAEKLLDFKTNQISSIDIKIKNKDKGISIQKTLQDKLGDGYKIQTRKELNLMFYKILNIENFIGYLICTLITIIALFNILGSIIMLIIDKKENLSTLFKIGASIKDIKKIFVFQGFLITLIGVSIGLFISITIILIQEKFSVFMMSKATAYPVEFTWTNVFVVASTIIILGFLASKAASSRISKAFVYE